MCGPSGTGKTTLINSLIPNYDAKTNSVSVKTNKGRHTTRHCEMIEGEDFKIIDTPGFSRLKFDFLLPDKLFDLFEDLSKYKDGCKYSNCTHDIQTQGICSVVDNMQNIEITRYQSYLEFLKETLQYKKDISQKSIKQESNFKNTGNRKYTKVSRKKRVTSRKVQRQNIEVF